MPRKKNPNNNYYNQQVEDAVCAYISTDIHSEKEKYFRIIYPAICKIAEVMYHKVKFSYSDDDREDIMASCVVHIVENMHKFQCGRGTKSFSYFTVMARFYYILLSNRNYKRFQQTIPLSSLPPTWDMENEDSLDAKKSSNRELYEAFLQYCYVNHDKIFIKPFTKFGYPLLEMLSNFELLEDLNRRKILNQLNENISNKPKDRVYITKMMTHLSAHYTLFKQRWDSGNNSMSFLEKNQLNDSDKEFIKKKLVLGKQYQGCMGMARTLGVDVKLIREYAKTIQ